MLFEKMNEEARCPICGTIEDLEYDQLAHLQNDITEDPKIRAQVVEAGGFCAFHFRQFRKLANDRTSAILLVEMITRHVDGLLQSDAACLICNRTKSQEAELEKAIISLLKTREFQSRYADSSGLCIPHLKHIVEVAQSQEIEESLRRAQHTQLSKLRNTLKNVIAKAYLDTTTDERGAIPRAVESFVGERGIAF